MTDDLSRVWLVYNQASGSNDERSLAELEQAFADAGCTIVGRTCFPDDDAPGPADLDGAEAQVLAVFGGDGTISSVFTGCYGWSGAALPLPGGTMNMLARRVHGEATAPEIVARLHADGRRVRPTIVRTSHGDALTGILAGPGTVWNDVREAMREFDVVEFVTSTTEAIGWSSNGPKVACLESDCGRDEGYSAITINPEDSGLRAKGYYAETIGDYAKQGVALLQRDFRNGPHDDLGVRPVIRLRCLGGEPMGLLIDGEPFDGAPEEAFELVRPDLDILATIDVQ